MYSTPLPSKQLARLGGLRHSTVKMEGKNEADPPGESAPVPFRVLREEFQARDVEALKQALERALAAGISKEDSRYQALLKLSQGLARAPKGKLGSETECQTGSRQQQRAPLKASLSSQQVRRLAVQKAALALLSRDAVLPRAVERALLAEAPSSSARVTEGSSGLGVKAAAIAKSPLLQAVQEAQPASLPASGLRQAKEERLKQRLQWRKETLEHLPLAESDVVRAKSGLEVQALKLVELQRKVRAEVALEQKLLTSCQPDQLLDWSMMRLKREDVLRSILRADPERVKYGCAALSSMVGVTAAALEADERARRKREADREARNEENKRKNALLVRRRFLQELLASYHEWTALQAAEAKRLKQRNDGVLNWHSKEAKRANRAERLRVQALKNDDQEAYLALVAESKNERLKTLLGATDELLERLGQMVQLQKEADDFDPVEERIRKKNPERHREQGQEGVASPRAKDASAAPAAAPEAQPPEPKRDLMAGQKKYNQSVHAIEEKVLVQPRLLVGGQLRSYQLEGLQWMLSLFNNNLNGILADEMGLGKTIQTISLIAYLFENKGVQGPHLIVAPKAVLPNWAHEFKTWAPTLSAVLYDGTLDTRRAIQQDPLVAGHQFNVLLTHYDLVMRDKAFLRKIRWHYFIVDEGHRLKNHESVLATTIVNHYHIKRRILLTGTPIQNNLQELWSLLNFVLPTIFNNVQNFEDWFNAPFAEKGDLALNEEEEILVIRRLQQVIRPFLLRRKKAEVEKHLPSKVQVVLKSDLSAWQRSYYKQILESSSVAVEGGQATGKSRSLMNTAMQLRKCCNHPYLFLDTMEALPDDPSQRVRASGKFELLDRILPKMKQTGHRILLFSQMTKLMDILEDYLEWRGYAYLRLDGNTKTDERRELLELYNAPDSPYFIFLLSTRAGGLGLNLQTADTVIMFDSDWNPAMDQQAEDRAHRIGQKKEVRVFVLVSVGSIEEEILERARSKMGIDAKVIQAGMFNQSSTAAERRELLEEIMRRGTQRLGTDVPSEREINRLLARTEDEFQMFEQIDAQWRRETKFSSRLLEEHEVPDWAHIREEESADVTTSAAENSAAGGKRKRSRVSYADPLSDEQWLQIVDEGGDVTKVAQERREAKERRKAKREERERQLEEEARIKAEKEAALEKKAQKKAAKRSKGSDGTAEPKKQKGSKRKHDTVAGEVDNDASEKERHHSKKRRRDEQGDAEATGEETGTETSALAAESAPAAGTSEAAPRKRDRRGKKRRKKGRRPPAKTSADNGGGGKADEAAASGPQTEIELEGEGLEVVERANSEGLLEDGGDLEELERGEGPSADGHGGTAEERGEGESRDEPGARDGVLHEGGDAEKGAPGQSTGQEGPEISGSGAEKNVVDERGEGFGGEKDARKGPVESHLEGPSGAEAAGTAEAEEEAGKEKEQMDDGVDVEKREGGEKKSRFGTRKRKGRVVERGRAGPVEASVGKGSQADTEETVKERENEKAEVGERAADSNGEALGGLQLGGGRAAVEEWKKVEKGSTGGLVLRLKLGVRSGGSSQRGDSKSELSNGRKRDGSEVNGELEGGTGHGRKGGGEELTDSNGVEKRVGKERSKRHRTNGLMRGGGGEGLGAGTRVAGVAEGAKVGLASTKESEESIEVRTDREEARTGDMPKNGGKDEGIDPGDGIEYLGKGLEERMPEKEADNSEGAGTNVGKDDAGVAEPVGHVGERGLPSMGRHPGLRGYGETQSHDEEGQKPAPKSRRARSRMRP
ncbi:putative SNF2 family DNA repair protein [Klebsormidium nitens]|uniref:DNA helicase n=1 Tax=Klebsormidium nitens TaxID=105231 RepID=A0A1Y1HKU9_KLENI|nr:putative SNF2 family DNA repair protein [Klebsormidium nitens]|eukprot:GAQ78262.1 putative SNF2 family DNA repair protein [Klebsormidium nitens]